MQNVKIKRIDRRNEQVQDTNITVIGCEKEGKRIGTTGGKKQNRNSTSGIDWHMVQIDGTT